MTIREVNSMIQRIPWTLRVSVMLVAFGFSLLSLLGAMGPRSSAEHALDVVGFACSFAYVVLWEIFPLLDRALLPLRMRRRFRKVFGVKAPTDWKDRRVLQVLVHQTICGRAQLFASCVIRESELFVRATANLSAGEVAKIQEELRLLRPRTQRAKEGFFSARDLASHFEFKIYGSWKDYLGADARACLDTLDASLEKDE